MNPRIFIHTLTLRGAGDDEVARYEFKQGVNVVVGPVGTGKTSLLHAIRWALGGSANWSSAVRTAVVTSMLDIELNDRRLVVTRYSDRPDLDVVDHETGELIARTRSGNRVGSTVSMSDFLLGQLGIPRIALPRARTRARRHQTSVSFWDVLDYVFVSQSRMDSSIVHHTNPVRDPKRVATFELLYGLLNEDLAALERQVGVLRSDLLETKSTVRGIKAFIDGGDTPPESVLRLEAERLAVMVPEATDRVTALRSEARSETPASAGLRELVLEQEAVVAGLRAKEHEAASEVGRYEALVAQLELDLDRIERGDVATEVLSPFEFTTCPRCAQQLARESSTGTCILCLQPEPDANSEVLVQAEHARLSSQLAETVALLTDADGDRSRASEALGQAQARLADLNAGLDAQLEAFVSRNYAAIEDATRALTEASARSQTVATLLALHDRYHLQSEAIPRLEQALRDTETKLTAERAGVEAARERIAVLSEMFDNLLKAFRYPWYPSGGASIDHDTYLPVVGQDSFAEASSGMQTLLNVAYHLAGLRYGLQVGDSLVPLFLVLDSPRKNLGNINDRSIGQEIYRRFRSLQDAYPARFQLILADNDPPPFAQDFNTLTLSYEHPFIPWVEHPGEGHVEPIEV